MSELAGFEALLFLRMLLFKATWRHYQTPAWTSGLDLIMMFPFYHLLTDEQNPKDPEKSGSSQNKTFLQHFHDIYAMIRYITLITYYETRGWDPKLETAGLRMQGMSVENCLIYILIKGGKGGASKIV